MTAPTAREIEVLARLGYEGWREVHVLGQQRELEEKRLPLPWPDLPALEQEAWRSAVRAFLRAMK